MKGTLALAILIVTTLLSTEAQNFDTSSLGKGYVYTLTDTLVGKVSVHLDDNTVLLNSIDGYHHISADEVMKVISIGSNGKPKVYYSGYFGLNHRKYLFEAIIDGEIPLLQREGLSFEEHGEEFDRTHFVLVNGSVHLLGKKKEILALFPSQADRLSTYLKNQKSKLQTLEEIEALFLIANHNLSNAGFMAGED